MSEPHRGPGRPAGSGEHDVQLGLRMPRSLVERLRRKAQESEITVSQLVRHLLDVALGPAAPGGSAQ